jgi:uncharacterized protein (DUF433 family)
MITTNPSICSGQPVFTGTRVLVDAIVGQLCSGVSRKELEADFPQIGANAFDWAETLVVGNTSTPASHD